MSKPFDWANSGPIYGGGVTTTNTISGNISGTNPSTSTIFTGGSFTPTPPSSVIPCHDPDLPLLIKLLGIEPCEPHPMALCLILADGTCYSLVSILHAQVQQMMRLNCLFAHRNLEGFSNED